MTAPDLLDELAAVWDAVPIPGEQWHPWVGEIRRLDADVRAALAVLAESDDGREQLEAALEEEPGDDEGADALGDAVRLLARLPRPVGHHPFLHEIVPGIEAAGVALAAVGRSAATRARFAELAQREAVSTPAGS